MKNRKSQLITIAILLIILLTLTISPSCDEGPTDPIIKPGRRDYTWEIDTLEIPYTTLQKIGGSSPSDVWAVGPGGDLDKTIYHYDGEKWNNDGISRGISPLSVWGYAPNDTWIAGGDGNIWHYNGNQWSENAVFYKEHPMQIGFQELWGNASNNIFAAGYSGFKEDRLAVIAHYNNSNWKLFEFPNINYNFVSIRGSSVTSSKYYLLGIGTENGTNLGIFEFDVKGDIKSIYEGYDNPKSWVVIQELNNQMFFIIGNKINKYVDNQLQLVKEINNINFGGQIFGRSENDIFLRMFDGIAHYNGSDIKYLTKFENSISIRDAVIFEEEIYFLAVNHNTSENLIFRGKLK